MTASLRKNTPVRIPFQFVWHLYASCYQKHTRSSIATQFNGFARLSNTASLVSLDIARLNEPPLSVVQTVKMLCEHRYLHWLWLRICSSRGIEPVHTKPTQCVCNGILCVLCFAKLSAARNYLTRIRIFFCLCGLMDRNELKLKIAEPHEKQFNVLWIRTRMRMTQNDFCGCILSILSQITIRVCTANMNRPKWYPSNHRI